MKWKSFIKDKWIYLVAGLIVFGIIYYRFGESLIKNIITFLWIAALILIIFSDNVRDFIGLIIGGGIVLYFVFFVFKGLFGLAAPFVLIMGIALCMYPKYQKNQKRKKEKQIFKEKQKKIDKAISGIEANGYFDNIFYERLKAFNAEPKALQSEVMVSNRQPNIRWLTLDQQLNFLEDNQNRINGLYLDFRERNFLNIIRNCFNYIQEVMYDSNVELYIRPLKELYSKYNFDYRTDYKKLNDSIYSYNQYSRKVLNDYYENLKGKRNGIIGEERVSKELSVYKDVIWNLQNIRFEVDGESVESDSILITENGIFSIEIKNYGQDSHDTIRITKDGQWIKEFQDGGKYVMKDVTSQLNRHIGYKQRFINEKLKEKLGADAITVRIQPLIVIANDDVYVQNESDLPIVRASNIYHHVMKSNGQSTLDKKYWEIIKEIIDENNLPPQKFPMEDYFESLQEEYKPLWEQIKAYYIFASMAKTYKYDLNRAGFNIPVENDQAEFLYKSEQELKGLYKFKGIII